MGKEYVKAVLPAASTEDPTHDKVMWKRPDEQGGSGLEGPPGPTRASTPKPESVCLSYYFMPFINSSDINHLSLEKINLGL